MEPRDFIDHAKAIVRAEKNRPKQVTLRRAISASYYGLFHALLKAAADDLIGTTRQARRSPSYRLVYRGFDHNDMKNLSVDAAKDTLPKKMAEVLGASRFSEDIRVVANRFVRLQQDRHSADYDPHVRFIKSDATLAIERAVTATAHFAAASETDRRNFLLCMLLPIR